MEKFLIDDYEINLWLSILFCCQRKKPEVTADACMEDDNHWPKSKTLSNRNVQRIFSWFELQVLRRKSVFICGYKGTLRSKHRDEFLEFFFQ